MNKIIILIPLFLFSVIPGLTQTDYNSIIRDGDKAMQNGNYLDALKKYDAAEAFDLASANLDLASINIAKAQKYINGLNLAKGNLAIVLNVPKGGTNPKYGFINKNGDVVIDYKYEDAAPFDYTGFARMKRTNHTGSKNNWEETTYLIDITGKEYKSAYSLVDLKKDITALDLRDTTIEAFPSGIFSQPQLKVLLLQGDLQTPITIPGEIKKLQNRECFSSLSYIIDSLPSETGLLNNLKSLIVSYSHLKSLPADIVKLEKLESLDLSGNSMAVFPAEIFSLSQLQSLNMASNSFDKIPEQIGNLEKLQQLDLQWNKLKSLPAQVGKLKNLQYLNLDKNILESLPDEIGQLKNLQDLVLTGNKLTGFPMEILPLTNLESLDLSANRSLKTIPPEISKLKNLRTLKLVNTSIPVSEQTRIKNLLPWCYIIFKEQK